MRHVSRATFRIDITSTAVSLRHSFMNRLLDRPSNINSALTASTGLLVLELGLVGTQG